MSQYKKIHKHIINRFGKTGPNITGIGFGQKQVAGQATKVPSIVFTVEKKIPAVELSDADLIPPLLEVDGKLYPTDVIETPRFRAMETCYDNNDGDTYEIARLRGQAREGVLLPMRGGQEIFIFPDGWDAYGGASLGTLGFFAIDNDDDRVVGVTNTHVAVANVLFGGDPVRLNVSATVDGIPQEVLHYDPQNTIEPRYFPVNGDKYHPGALARDASNLHHAALYIKKYIPYSTENYNDVDAACLIMNNGMFLKDGRYYVDENSYKIWRPTDIEEAEELLPPVANDHYPFATTEEIDALTHAAYGAAGARCYSTGRTTGPKGYCDAVQNSILRVININYTSQINYGTLEDGTAIVPYFDNLISYKSSDETTWRASLPGDSGSCLLADVYPVDGNGDPVTSGGTTRKIIGIVFAGNGVIGLANRIDLVADRLNIRAWDANYVFDRDTSLSIPTPRIITTDVSAAVTPTYARTEGGTEFVYWHAGLTFQQYYVQYAPTDIILSNNTISETATGGSTIGYFSTTDADIFDTYVYSLVSGDGDDDNDIFRIISDQLQVNIPVYNECETDQHWQNVYLLISARYNCSLDLSGAELKDNSRFARALTLNGNTVIVDQSYAEGNGFPSPPNERFITEFNKCGYGYVDTGTTHYITVDDDTDSLEGDFCIEGWLYATTTPSTWTEQEFLSTDNLEITLYSIHGTHAITIDGNEVLKGSYMSSGDSVSPLSPFVLPGAWNHVAWIRRGRSYAAYVNGNKVPSPIRGVILQNAPAVSLSNLRLLYNWDGYFEDIRITANARYVTVADDAQADDVYAFPQYISAPLCPFPQTGPIIFDYETKNQYTIRVRATDSGGNDYEKSFTITLLDALEYPPTDITLTYLAEAQPLYSDWPLSEPFGTFTTADEDINDSHTYFLVSGEGDDDNARFAINADQISPVNLTPSGGVYPVDYSIRVQTRDLANMSFTKVFTITVDEPPPTPYGTGDVDATFSANQVNPANALAATLRLNTSASADWLVDGDINDLVFALVSGAGADDNALFEINNSVTRVDANSTLAELRVLSTGGGITYQDLDSNGYLYVRIRITDVVSERFSEFQLTLDMTSPTPPYGSLTYYTNICSTINNPVPADTEVDRFNVYGDSQSTFTDFNVEFSTECGGTGYENDLFALEQDTTAGNWILKTRADSAVDFSAYSNGTIDLCFKLTDTRTGLIEYHSDQLYPQNCGSSS